MAITFFIQGKLSVCGLDLKRRKSNTVHVINCCWYIMSLVKYYYASSQIYAHAFTCWLMQGLYMVRLPLRQISAHVGCRSTDMFPYFSLRTQFLRCLAQRTTNDHDTQENNLIDNMDICLVYSLSSAY